MPRSLICYHYADQRKISIVQGGKWLTLFWIAILLMAVPCIVFDFDGTQLKATSLLSRWMFALVVSIPLILMAIWSEWAREDIIVDNGRVTLSVILKNIIISRETLQIAEIAEICLRPHVARVGGVTCWFVYIILSARMIRMETAWGSKLEAGSFIESQLKPILKLS